MSAGARGGILVEGLWKSFGGRTVLRDLSFRIGPGGAACLTAPSGGGKTTLLRILLDLETPDQGRIVLPEGLRWSAVFQEDRLLGHLDARDNLRLVLGRSWDEGEAAALLDELRLGDGGDKRIRDWSGGMRRRLALARALLSPSDALALDEPFTGLGAEDRERCLDAVRRRRGGRILVLATHDPRDGAALDAGPLPIPSPDGP